MKKTFEIGKRYFRPIPCPAYDISKMEEWLSDMSAMGLFLEKDGITGGFAVFVCGAPGKIKYRLEAVKKSTGLWSEDNGEPSEEEKALGEKYSWEYVAKRKNFYIYRCADPNARELNTDPTVQALALNEVKKQLRGSLISSLFSLVVYPLLLTRGCVLLTAIHMGSWWVLLALMFCVLRLAERLRAFLYVRKVQKALLSNGLYDSGPRWEKDAASYFVRKLVTVMLSVLLLCAIFLAWGASVSDKRKVSLDNYSGTIPFATIKDFAGEGNSDYTPIMRNLGFSVYALEEKTDWLASRFLDYTEHASVRRADGTRLEGGLYVEYYEMKSEGLAKLAFRELSRFERLKKRNIPMEPPELPAEDVLAFRDDIHYPCILMRVENVVVRGAFYQFSEPDVLSFPEWTQILCESVSK